MVETHKALRELGLPKGEATTVAAVITGMENRLTKLEAVQKVHTGLVIALAVGVGVLVLNTFFGSP